MINKFLEVLVPNAAMAQGLPLLSLLIQARGPIKLT